MLQWTAEEFCLSALRVICPKCARGQEIGGDIPAGGTDHACLYCNTVFKVKPPISRLGDDLPAPREAIPRPEDLPVSRDAVPRPGDLPVSRDAVPRAGDLPQSKAWALPGRQPGSAGGASKTLPLGVALDLSWAPQPEATGGSPPLSLDFDSPASPPSASGPPPLSLDFDSPASPPSASGPPPSGFSLDLDGFAGAPPAPSPAPPGLPKTPPAPTAAKGTGAALPAGRGSGAHLDAAHSDRAQVGAAHTDRNPGTHVGAAQFVVARARVSFGEQQAFAGQRGPGLQPRAGG